MRDRLASETEEETVVARYKEKMRIKLAVITGYHGSQVLTGWPLKLKKREQPGYSG